MSGLKKILFGTAMFGLGAFVGYFICDKKFGAQYRMDIADVQDFYRKKLDELGVMPADFEFPEDENPDEIEEGHEDEDEDDDEEYNAEEAEKADALASYRGIKRRYVYDYTKPSLESIRRGLEGKSVVVAANGEENLGKIDEDVEDEDDYRPSDDPEYEAELERIADDYAKRRADNMKRGEPYLIEPEEYQDGPDNYDRQALYYYTQDRTLCEDDDSRVEDEEECVGLDYEDKLDMQTTCWVRNDTLRVLYEIHRVEDSYKKAVLGVVETPREREFRIQGRRKRALDDR